MKKKARKYDAIFDAIDEERIIDEWRESFVMCKSVGRGKEQ